jgi:hypothetical protein
VAINKTDRNHAAIRCLTTAAIEHHPEPAKVIGEGLRQPTGAHLHLAFRAVPDLTAGGWIDFLRQGGFTLDA